MGVDLFITLEGHPSSTCITAKGSDQVQDIIRIACEACIGRNADGYDLVHEGEVLAQGTRVLEHSFKDGDRAELRMNECKRAAAALEKMGIWPDLTGLRGFLDMEYVTTLCDDDASEEGERYSLQEKLEILSLFVLALPGVLEEYRNGKTLLQECVFVDTETVQLLIDLGSKVNAVSSDGAKQTILHQACAYGVASLVKLLLSCGADASLKDAKGRLAVDLAKGDDLRAILSKP
eukprot:TRINITY_DN13664_c2_g1_i1.p1 TRINITY_DN13664_c2_g1~~TRINITY_DN13664_c2_g1_i1.p1  ORF type:complete len:253 (+),score=46.22 TRINITY_DN13664_c2_g1_i1:60-761(+)